MGLLETFVLKAAVSMVKAGAKKNGSEASQFERLAKATKNTSFTKDEVAIRTLLENTTGGVRNKIQVTYSKYDFEVTLLEAKTLLSDNRTKNPYTAEVRFLIALPNAETLLTERYDSIGETINGAVAGAVKKFAAVLNDMFELIDGADDDLIENYFDGRAHVYRYETESMVSCVGAPALQEIKGFYSEIEDELPAYLGAKKYYWLSMEALFSGDHVSAKCRINNEEIGRLSELVEDKARRYFTEGIYGQVQEQKLIVQSDRTYVRVKPKYNDAYNNMYKYIRQCIPLMGQSSVLESYNELFRKVQAITGDAHSAWEVMTFLPEIYVQWFFKIKGTGLVSMKIGDRELELTEFQISPMRVIKSEVESFLEKNKPCDEFNQNIFSMSARFESAMKALNSGVKEEELAFGTLSVEAPADYVIW
ncbi:DUF6348 family protein [uncultured Ruminococcus sp.]|uniref:DUF6348 family protein n=1 Tax=uncultured Ruminococcus sp. TaxID=165186 RepID=UPI0025CEE4E2|nr:DUF6348 family protein [uncultured Ruminococcus sp.]